MTDIKEKILMEVEKIPEDRIAELYDVIHFFRKGVETQTKEVKDKQQEVLSFFGIWKDMSPEETAVLDKIQSRRKMTFRDRIL